jgi:FHA domain
VATLRLIPQSGTPIEITKDPALVGRDPSCEVVLNDGSVSRRHARIEKRGAEWAIVDQGSANGTYLDTERVTDAALRDGQDLRLGSVSLRVEIGGVDLSATIGGTSDATLVQAAATPPTAPSTPAPPVPPPAPAAPPSAAPPAVPPRVPPPPPPPPPAAPPRAGASPVRPMDAGTAPPPRKGKGPLFWIATGCFGCLTMVALVLGLIAGAFYFMTKGPTDVVDRFLGDLRGGKLDEAYALLSQDYQARLSRDAFESAVAEHPGLKDNAEGRFTMFKGGSVSIVNDRGTVKGALVSTSGQQEKAVIALVKEGGSWKITSIALDGNDLAGGTLGLSLGGGGAGASP